MNQNIFSEIGYFKQIIHHLLKKGYDWIYITDLYEHANITHVIIAFSAYVIMRKPKASWTWSPRQLSISRHNWERKQLRNILWGLQWNSWETNVGEGK